MSWFTDGAAAPQPGPPASGAPRPWLPPSWPEAMGQPVAGADAHALAPPLAFDEGEVARVAAAVRLGVEREARAACAAEPAARQADALDRLARELRTAMAERRAEAEASSRHVARLAEAIGGAAAADPPGEPRRIRSIVIGMMAALAPAPPALRLLLDPTAAELLRPLLPEIAAEADLAGSIELKVDHTLPPGAVRLIWSGGWLEHDPATIAARIGELMAASCHGDELAATSHHLEVPADANRSA